MNAEVLVPVIASLVAIVGFFVRWLVQQATKDDEATREREAACLERVAMLEGRVTRLEEDVRAERHQKHEAMASAATYLGALRVVKQLYQSLDITAFDVALPQLLSVLPEREEPAA